MSHVKLRNEPSLLIQMVQESGNFGGNRIHSIVFSDKIFEKCYS